MQNLGPGAIERLGFGFDALRERYPRLIICSISGYGRGGPYENRKAFDLLLQGETGVIATTGTGEAPAKVGISVGDIGAGVYGAMATTAALYERKTTGQGRLVETSLFDALAEWMGYPVAYTQYGGEPPPRAGVRHATVVPYGSYRCGDGEAVNLAVQTERQWSSFCHQVCERPEWTADPRYATSAGRRQHRAELEAGIEAAFAPHARSEIARRLEVNDIPFGEILEIADFIAHPQLAARERWQTVDSPAGPLTRHRAAIRCRGDSAADGRDPRRWRADRRDFDRTGVRRLGYRRIARGGGGVTPGREREPSSDRWTRRDGRSGTLPPWRGILSRTARCLAGCGAPGSKHLL